MKKKETPITPEDKAVKRVEYRCYDCNVLIDYQGRCSSCKYEKYLESIKD